MIYRLCYFPDGLGQMHIPNKKRGPRRFSNPSPQIFFGPYDHHRNPFALRQSSKTGSDRFAHILRQYDQMSLPALERLTA